MTPTPAWTASEPDPSLRASPARALLLATRPAFLTITAVGVLLGGALATWQEADHARDGLAAALLLFAVTLFLALTAHAAANVLNDLFDEAVDRGNTTRLYPFTGGSRFLQNSVLTRAELTRLAATLLLVTALGGLLLILWLFSVAPHRAAALAVIGIAGLATAWAYSAPPLRLSARGLGEIAITLAWTLVVAGAATVVGAGYRSDAASASVVTAIAAGVPFGLLVANILFINQFPDAPADGAGDKRTIPVRWGARAAWGYPLIALGAAVTHVAWVAIGLLPPLTLVALVALIPALSATRRLFAFVAATPHWSHTTDFSPLIPAIVATLQAAHGYALVAAATLIGSAFR